jgi:L-iditol 2-dehydrogenase
MTTDTTMRASLMTGVGTLQIEDRPVPTPGPHEVLVEVAAVGVCGSDVHYYRHGRIGDFVVEQPMILGHELSGRIAAVGEQVDPTRVGQRVAVEPQHPCRRCKQYRGALQPVPLHGVLRHPADRRRVLSLRRHRRRVRASGTGFHVRRRGRTARAAVVAVTTMRKAHVQPGSSILIAGAGPIGVMCAQAARAFGAARIVVSDPLESRRESVLRFGATEVLDPMVDDVAALDPRWTPSSTPAVRHPPWSVASRRSVRPDTSSWSAWAPATSRCPSATSRTWRST